MSKKKNSDYETSELILLLEMCYIVNPEQIVDELAIWGAINLLIEAETTDAFKFNNWIITV